MKMKLDSNFVVQDLTGKNSPEPCKTQEQASFIVRQWTKWQPEARPATSTAEDIIYAALNAGLVCAEKCPLNTTYHKRVIKAALTLFTSVNEH